MEKLSPAAREVLRELSAPQTVTATTRAVTAVSRLRTAYRNAKGSKIEPKPRSIEVSVADAEVLLELVNYTLSGNKRKKPKPPEEFTPDTRVE